MQLCNQRFTLRVISLLFALFGACTSAQTAHVRNLYDVQRDVERYIASGEYDRDFARVVTDARAYLERRAKLPNPVYFLP